MSTVRFFDENGDQVDELDPDDSCNPREFGDQCGGCGRCLMLMAVYAGFVDIDGDMYPPDYKTAVEFEPEPEPSRPWAEIHDEMQNGWWRAMRNQPGEER